MKHVLPIVGLLVAVAALEASDLQVRSVEFDPVEGFAIKVAKTPGTYLVLMRGTDPAHTDIPVALVLPGSEEEAVRLRDPDVFSRSFYAVHQFSTSNPADSDEDGIDDLFELRHPLLLDPLDPDDAAQDSDGDGDSNLTEYSAGSNPAEVRQSTVSFVTTDRIRIQATLRIPAARDGTHFPVVILIHQGSSSRAEWAPYDDTFNQAGYLTLAYDIRGHGSSEGSFSSADFDDPETTPRDLEAALDYLRNRDEVDPARLGVVGASIGGNLACVASQKRWVKSAVNLSGKTSAVQNLAQAPNLTLASMFHIAAAGDAGGQRATWANELYRLTRPPRLVEVVPGSSAHGVSIFNSDPSLLDRIVEWLDDTM